MANQEFVECLSQVYQDEVTGEVVFETALSQAESAEQEYILGTILQFETEGKAMLRPLLSKFGLSLVEDDAAKEAAAAAAGQMNALTWTERFAAIRDIVKGTYLPRYEELATLVSEKEDTETARIAAFMGRHERAILELAENIVAGRPDPAAPVAALLHFPLPKE